MTGMEAGVGEVAEGEEGIAEVAGREGNTADMVAQTSRKRLPVTLSVLGDVTRCWCLLTAPPSFLKAHLL